jgi:hypothetical protein
VHLLMSGNYSMYTGDEVMVTEYVPPEVLKIGAMKSGAGEDCLDGSNNANDCQTYGNIAGSVCLTNGSSAGDECADGGDGYECDTGGSAKI